MITLERAENETELRLEQDRIKTYLECVAVFDIPKGYTASLYVHDYGTDKQGYGLYLYKERQEPAVIHNHIYTKDRNETRKMKCSCGDTYTPAT